MPGNYQKPTNVTGPVPGDVLWCPCCDWHMADNHSNRKRLGSHLAGCHHSEVAFPEGVLPPDLKERETENQ